jgi:alkyl hydroperoxide reductase subunit AhpF
MPDKFLNNDITRQVREVFQQLQHPVTVLFFGSQHDCQMCSETEQLAQEVVELSAKLSLQSFDTEQHADLARQYRVDKTPTLVIAGQDGEQLVDYGVRFAGIPSGHEFSSFIHTLLLVSGRDSGLNPATRQFLQTLDKPVHLQVFVTPT